jgi:hypothetical protein
MSVHMGLRGVPVVLAGALLVAVAAAVPASASATGDSLQNGSGELCLSATAAGTVSAVDCSGPTNSLQWTAPYVSGGVGDADEVFQLQNVVTGQCLETTAGSAVTTASCGTAAAQDWTADGSEVLVSQATGLCLTGAHPGASESEAVDMTACGNVDNPPDAQQWFWGEWDS